MDGQWEGARDSRHGCGQRAASRTTHAGTSTVRALLVPEILAGILPEILAGLKKKGRSERGLAVEQRRSPSRGRCPG